MLVLVVRHWQSLAAVKRIHDVTRGRSTDSHFDYLKEHYLNYPCVLVRLSRVRTDALRDLIAGAHRFVSAKVRRTNRL